MRWNGTDITGVPTFIYHDELITGPPGANLAPNPDGPGVLSCSTGIGALAINWHFVDRMINPASMGGNILLRIGTRMRTRTQVLQNENNPFPTGGRQDAFLNGLWSCTQNLYVGLYFRSSSEWNKICGYNSRQS